MAKKPIPAKSSKPIAKPIMKAPVTSPVRNSSIPKVVAAAAPAPKQIAPNQITGEQIAKRAYEIFASGTGGSEQDNWFRAEHELRGK